MTTRREVLCGGALTLTFLGLGCGCPGHAQSRRTPNTLGCVLADSDVDRVYAANAPTTMYATGQEPLVHSSGDRQFDRALAETLARCSTMLQVLPGFAFFDDYDGMNAYATSRVRLQRADGTVIFGTRLLGKLLRQPEAPDACVAAVCVHEFAHILQFKLGLIQQLTAGQPTVKRAELHADYFAGYFAGHRKRERPNFPAAVFAMTQYTFGDNMVSSPQHHGTHEERGAAVVRGFEAAYRQNLGLGEAIEQGVRYVSRL
ncbi:MAG TPA: metalloprotease [Reyranellaceae bacterium]|nr:metalloprotease [Reyranellaceae bacterium]